MVKFLLHLAVHTASADFNTDLDFLVAGESTPKWEQMGDGRPMERRMATPRIHKVNDVVKYRGIVYNCIDSLTSATTLTPRFRK